MQQLKLSPTNAPNKILLVTTERIGDTLFVTPAIHLLKQALPEIQLDVLAFAPVTAAIFQDNPNINTIYTSTNKFTTKNLIKQYPLIINLSFENLEKKFWKFPENFVSIPKWDMSIHRSLQTVNFIKSLLESPPKDTKFEYAIFPKIEHQQNVKTLLQASGVNLEKDILIGCQLGCHRVARRGWKFWNSKRHQHKKVWPIENYVELAQRLKNSAPNIHLILTGSQSERYLANMFLAQYPNVIDLIGKTNVHELAVLMDLLKVLVTHDTGTLHLACARNTPLVAMYGPTPFIYTGPFPLQPNHLIINKPSMLDITVTEVYESAMKFI